MPPGISLSVVKASRSTGDVPPGIVAAVTVGTAARIKLRNRALPLSEMIKLPSLRIAMPVGKLNRVVVAG